MTQSRETIEESLTCPHCSALNQKLGSQCEGCGRRVIKLPEWARKQSRRGLFGRRGLIFVTHNKVTLLIVALLLGGAFIWHNYHIVPNPVTLIFKSPSTQLSSVSAPGEWAMAGYDLENTRYIPQASTMPQGHLLWSTDENYLVGESRPVVVDDTLYVGSHFKFIALDADTGEEVWEKEMRGLINSTPAIAEDNIYFSDTDQRIYSLDRHTGEPKWIYKTEAPNRGSATVHNGIVFIGSGDKHMYALDAATGKRLWRFKAGSVLYNPPALDDGVLYFLSEANLYSVNYRTGQSRMNFRVGRGISVFDAPVVAHGLVYMVSDWGILTAKAGIREIPGRWSIERMWRILWVKGFPVPDPPPQQGFNWRFSTRERRTFIRSAPAVTPEAFFVGDDGGFLYARDAKDATELWTVRVDDQIKSSPVVVNDTIYFGTKAGTLYALDRYSGTELWSTSLGAPIEIPPSYAEGKLFVRTSDGRIHAVE